MPGAGAVVGNDETAIPFVPPARWATASYVSWFNANCWPRSHSEWIEDREGRNGPDEVPAGGRAAREGDVHADGGNKRAEDRDRPVYVRVVDRQPGSESWIPRRVLQELEEVHDHRGRRQLRNHRAFHCMRFHLPVSFRNYEMIFTTNRSTSSPTNFRERSQCER
jgi:hypothetical protein